MKFKIQGTGLGCHLALIAVALASLAPLLYALDLSLQNMKDLFGTTGIIPAQLTLSNYAAVFAGQPIGKLFANTLYMAVMVTVFKTITSTLAAYAFAFFDFPGKNALYLLLISTIFIPFRAC